MVAKPSTSGAMQAYAIAERWTVSKEWLMIHHDEDIPMIAMFANLG